MSVDLYKNKASLRKLALFLYHRTQLYINSMVICVYKNIITNNGLLLVRELVEILLNKSFFRYQINTPAAVSF